MKFVFTLVSMLGVLLLAAAPIDSVGIEKRSEGTFVIHVVEEGETLYSISRRYKGSVVDVIKHNQIVDNRIEIGQTLYVLINTESPTPAKVIITSPPENIHIVQPGETLYSLGKRYDVRLKDLKKWNKLSNNNLAPGMQLKLTKNAKIAETAPSQPKELPESTPSTKDKEPESADPYRDFRKYLVQTGETLTTIAQKIGVSLDSLRQWNMLESDYLKIGQEIFFKNEKEASSTKINEPSKKLRKQIDEDGFERVFEEGLTSAIESMKTTRFLALHRSLPIGTNLKVRNLMNNQVVYVKVVGKLPNTGLNKNLLLRLSQPAYDQLGILDSKSRVEVSYNKQ